VTRKAWNLFSVGLQGKPETNDVKGSIDSLNFTASERVTAISQARLDVTAVQNFFSYWICVETMTTHAHVMPSEPLVDRLSKKIALRKVLNESEAPRLSDRLCMALKDNNLPLSLS
jgi:hypothetical protein